jgi:hypothetical protein
MKIQKSPLIAVPAGVYPGESITALFVTQLQYTVTV